MTEEIRVNFENEINYYREMLRMALTDALDIYGLPSRSSIERINKAYGRLDGITIALEKMGYFIDSNGKVVKYAEE